MLTPNPSSFMEDQFPKSLWPLIPTTLRTAYAAAMQLAEAEPILQVESAKANHGRLIAWATDFCFERLIKSGQLPFDYRWKYFANPTGKYLEIRMSHSVASISQVGDSKKQPRSVVFRENSRLSNQQVLDLGDLRAEQEINGLPHLLIIHGHQALSFAHLALPHPTLDQWICKTPNMMNMPHAVPATGPSEENTDTDFDEVNLLKEEIEKWRRDNE